MLSLLGLSLLVDRHLPRHPCHLPKGLQDLLHVRSHCTLVLRYHANLFLRNDTWAKHTRQNLSQGQPTIISGTMFGWDPTSYSHVCLLSHPSVVPSKPAQLPACPRNWDAALPYKATASNSLAVEKGFLSGTVQVSNHSPACFAHPAWRDIVAPFFNTKFVSIRFTPCCPSCM